MATGREITGMHVPGCLPTEARRSLDQAARNFDIIKPLTSGAASSDLKFNITNLYVNNEGDTPPPEVLSVVGGALRVFTLGADLNSGATVVNGGTTYSAAFVRSSFKLTSGTTVGALRATDGTYYIIAWNTCEQPQ